LTIFHFEGNASKLPKGDNIAAAAPRQIADRAQLVIALVLTTEGQPLASEDLSGHPADNNTLRMFLRTIERQCGKALKSLGWWTVAWPRRRRSRASQRSVETICAAAETSRACRPAT
jgi:hypothetical protein